MDCNVFLRLMEERKVGMAGFPLLGSFLSVIC